MNDKSPDTTETDQLVLQNPVTRYPKISPPAEKQPGTGSDADLRRWSTSWVASTSW